MLYSKLFPWQKDKKKRTIYKNEKNEELIQELRSEGIADEKILTAIRTVPRELFTENLDEAYLNKALSVECGQTLTQPFCTAYMASFLNLRKTDNILDIGCGVGWSVAIFPGSETKLLRGLEIGCNGVISAICNVLAPEARRVYDDFKNGKEVQDINEQLIAVRTAFDQHNLISALHTYKSLNNSVYKNVIPPIKLLDENDRRKLFDTLEKLKFRKAA